MVKTLRPLSGPLPRGKAVQVKACDILAAFALSRRRIRYSGVAKDAAFGPKWWPTIFVPRSLALREAGLKGERGLRAPRRGLRPSSRHGGFQNCRDRASSTTTSGVCSAIGRNAGGRQLQSHPRPSPADGRLNASDFIGRGEGHCYETARYRRRPLRWPQHRHTSRWPPPGNGIINAATGWKANWGPACSFHFRGGDRMDVKWHVLSTAGGIIWRLGDLEWSFYPRLRDS